MQCGCRTRMSRAPTSAEAGGLLPDSPCPMLGPGLVGRGLGFVIPSTAVVSMSSAGRGAYFKNKYGSRGGGRGGGGASSRGGGRGHRGRGRRPQAPRRSGAPAPAPLFAADGSITAPYVEAGTLDDLHGLLRGLEGNPYGAYKNLEETTWRLVEDEGFIIVDRVQNDPYAPPSRVRIVLTEENACLPALASKAERVAAADWATRRFFEAARAAGDDKRTETGGWGGRKGGELRIAVPSQFVLERTAATVSPAGALELRLTVSLPARGRTIEGACAAEIVCDRLVALAEGVCARRDSVSAHVDAVMEQQHLRSQLKERGLAAFVADGSALPRRAGDDDRRMASCVPFDSMLCGDSRVELTRRDGTAVSGLGLPAGKVSLICGGGFHGKSTLLQALQVGSYDKVPGDGREGVVTTESAAKIRAEDGRFASAVDVSAFLGRLPTAGFDAQNFSTLDASGSTSQAAAIAEALEAGAETLLFDEDTCATNFMIRDDRMRELVANEPITPLVDRIADLAGKGVASILVIGGTGDFFAAADVVIVMDTYQPRDATARAKSLAGEMRTVSPLESYFLPREPCKPFLPVGRAQARAMNMFQYGDNNDVDLKALEQLVELGQTAAICAAICTLANLPSAPLSSLLDNLELHFEATDLDCLAQGHGGVTGDLARPRKLEIAAAINRCRTITFRRCK